MKRIPLIGLALLMILLSLVGCKDSPEIDPNVPTQATTEGFSSRLKLGESAEGKTITITLQDGITFKNIDSERDVTDWFSNLPSGVRVKAPKAGVASKNLEDKEKPKEEPVIAYGVKDGDKTAVFTLLGKVESVPKEPIKMKIPASFTSLGKDIEVTFKKGDTTTVADTRLTVTFDHNNGTGKKDVVKVDKDSKIPSDDRPKDPQMDGATFKGWFDDADVAFSFDNVITKDTVLKAKWESTIEFKTISFDGNGATAGSAPDPIKLYVPNKTLKLPNCNTLEKDYLVFCGWNTKADGSGTSYMEGAVVEIDSSITLYAIWKEMPLRFEEKGNYTYGRYYVVEGSNKEASTIIIPAIYKGLPVKEIRQNAFYGYKKLTSIHLPETLEVIGGSAFFSCESLTSIHIPESVTSIGTYVFTSCYNLQDVILSPNMTKIPDGTFENCHSLKNLTIPSNIKGIGERSFQQCNKLQTIEIPEGVTVIGEEAFFECKNLSSVTIPSTVTTIRSSAFKECSSLTSVELPVKLEEIDGYAFKGCTGITSINIPDNVSYIGDGAFQNTGLTTITIPKNVSRMGIIVFAYCSNMESLNVDPQNPYYYSERNCIINKTSNTVVYGCKNSVLPTDKRITTIGQSAFEGCTGLTEIEIPDNIEVIDGWAFCGSGLKSFTFPKRKMAFGSSVFSKCTELKTIEIPYPCIENIQNDFFKDCTSLESVTITSGIKKIGAWAFSGCTSLRTISIPLSVTKIEGEVFCNDSNLHIKYGGSKSDWGKTTQLDTSWNHLLESYTVVDRNGFVIEKRPEK